MNVVSSDIDSNILDHLKVRWNEKEAEVIDLQERLAGESQKANEAEGILKRVVDMMGMAGSTIGSTLFGAIRTPWTQLQAKVNDLETALLQERVKSAKTKENLQDLANFCGVDQTPGNESTLLASIKDKWKETQEKVSQQELSLQTEMEKNRTNMKDMQDLAAFMGVAPCEGDKVPLADMMSKWLDSRAEVTDLQEALRQEREKSRRVEEALQIHLQKTSPMTSSVSIQTDVTEIHQRTKVQSVSPVEIEQPTSSNCDSPATLSPPLQTSDELQRLAHGAIPKMSRVKAEEATPKNLPQRIVGGAPTESNESLSQTPPFLGARGSSREEEELCELSSGCEGLASDVMVVSSMADITAWDETTDRIELGCGAVATVFLCRHANTKRPVALKVGWHLSVFCPDEVRIHSALSGLPWFPAFYGSFKMADGQTALAMEFLGSEAECRSYTVADCLNTEGPHLSRTDWFDVIIDVAEGLQAMHDRGYLYNDLKVDNVLVTKQEDIWRGKLIDFGISSDTSSPFEVPVDDELIEEYESTGECGHIAPECVLEGMPCSTSTDVYALGKLLMVIGRERAQCDLLCYGTEICGAEWNQRPRLEEVITKLYNLQLHEGEEDDADSSSC
ncbi:uncharacterized protein [Diadema setosum]|uniref:uncharacterized protein n=1 Tax=Diadema setosum TaxID=31175 RepID=UPI003B3AFA28